MCAPAQQHPGCPAPHLCRASMPIHSAQASLWMSICHGSSLHMEGPEGGEVRAEAHR